MPMIRGSVPSLIGGVSQQDASVRLPIQLEACVNSYLSASKGAGPRPPARFVASLGTDIPATASFHTVERDQREKYLVVIYGHTIRVFNHVTGHEYTVVTHAGSESYLDTEDDQWRSLRLTTVADTTFVTNRDKVVAMTKSESPGWIAGDVQILADLSDRNPTPGGGAVYRVVGDQNSGFGKYFVNTVSQNVYEEVPKPGAPNELDKATMPHVLKRVPDGTNPDGMYFAFGPHDWGKRLAGDEKSSKAPSIVGKRLGGLAYFKSRLCFLTQGSIVMSEVGNYENLWRTTVTALLDSDPIDINVPTEGVATLTHAVPYQSSLMLVASGKTTLFQLMGNPVLSPKTVHIEPVLNYEASPYVEPALAGSSLFFVNDSTHTPWSTVREYFVSDQQVTPDATDVTSHVPEYVPGNTRVMAAIPDADALVVAHENASGPQLFVHQFRWQGNNKVQSAWGEWHLQGVGDIRHAAAIETTLYLAAATKEGGAELLALDMTAKEIMADTGVPFDILLDRRERVTPTYTQFGNYTDITLPFVVDRMDDLVVLKGDQWASPASYLELSKATLKNGGSTVRLPGRHDDGDVIVGLRYQRQLMLSTQFVRDQKGNAVTVGRLQLRRGTVRYTHAADFSCVIYPKARQAQTDTLVPMLTSVCAGRTTGDAAFLLNSPEVREGNHKFLIQAQAHNVDIALESNSPFPAWFQSLQWEANYTSREAHQ